MATLTSRTLTTGASLNDLIHIVITGDTSQSAQGSSYKARLSQLVPLFGGSPDVFLTGGTSNSTGGTMTFTNSTGGTFTVTGTTTPFSGGSGNCINALYVTNVHACIDEITVHNRVQSTGSDAQSLLSFAFGGNVQALNRYTHAEGEATIASGWGSHAEGLSGITYGVASHAEGYKTKTGTNNAYLSTGITSGVIYLSGTYGDVSSGFTVGEYIPIQTSSFSIDSSYEVSGVTYLSGQTIIYLIDTTLLEASAFVGETTNPNNWSGNQTMGGLYSNSKGSDTYAIGTNSLSCGVNSLTFGTDSFAANKGSRTYGKSSFSTGINTRAYGVGSFVGGEGSISKGINSFAIGYNTRAIGNRSFSHGYYTNANGENTVVIGGEYNLVNSGTTTNSGIFGGKYNIISGATGPSDPSNDSSIIGGSGNTITIYNSSIIASQGSTLIADHSVILGGISISGTQVETVYVPNFVVKSNFTPSGTTDPTGEVGQITYDATCLYFRGVAGWKRLSGATW